MSVYLAGARLLDLLTRVRLSIQREVVRYGPGALAEMEAALREDRGMAEDAVT